MHVVRLTAQYDDYRLRLGVAMSDMSTDGIDERRESRRFSKKEWSVVGECGVLVGQGIRSIADSESRHVTVLPSSRLQI